MYSLLFNKYSIHNNILYFLLFFKHFLHIIRIFLLNKHRVSVLPALAKSYVYCGGDVLMQGGHEKPPLIPQFAAVPTLPIKR